MFSDTVRAPMGTDRAEPATVAPQAEQKNLRGGIDMKKIVLFATCALLGSQAWAGEAADEAHPDIGGNVVCQNFGPQAPRDIDSTGGANPVMFDLAPSATDMHLCNVHFHENAEHKAKDFNIYAGDGHHGYDSGFQCAMSKQLGATELAWEGAGVCASEHGDLEPGDTIEVHWVYTTCDVPGGPTLGACVSPACANPQLRVETQVFTLVAEGGLDFNRLQTAADLPTNTGSAVAYVGSTTGPKYSAQSCSPYQVTWHVRPRCTKLNVRSVGDWCKGNKYEEDHAHGVRALVVQPELLSEIK